MATKGPKKKTVKKAPSASRYIFAIGRRKTARAKVKLFPGGTGQIEINKQPLEKYFPTFASQKIVLQPLDLLGVLKKYNAIVSAVGGGIMAQAQATALGISRALVKLDPNSRLVLKKHGLLRRDARKKERKKPGLKRARRAPQWQKR